METRRRKKKENGERAKNKKNREEATGEGGSIQCIHKRERKRTRERELNGTRGGGPSRALSLLNTSKGRPSLSVFLFLLATFLIPEL